MTDKTFSIVAHFVKSSRAQTFIRPYLQKESLHSDLALYLDWQSLDSSGDVAVTLKLEVVARTPAKAAAYSFECEFEGIAHIENISDVELPDLMEQLAAPSLLGYARSVITALSAQTGYGPVVLPAIPAESVKALLEKTRAARDLSVAEAGPALAASSVYSSSVDR